MLTAEREFKMLNDPILVRNLPMASLPLPKQLAQAQRCRGRAVRQTCTARNAAPPPPDRNQTPPLRASATAAPCTAPWPRWAAHRSGIWSTRAGTRGFRGRRAPRGGYRGRGGWSWRNRRRRSGWADSSGSRAGSYVGVTRELTLLARRLLSVEGRYGRGGVFYVIWEEAIKMALAEDGEEGSEADAHPLVTSWRRGEKHNHGFELGASLALS